MGFRHASFKEKSIIELSLAYERGRISTPLKVGANFVWKEFLIKRRVSVNYFLPLNVLMPLR